MRLPLYVVALLAAAVASTSIDVLADDATTSTVPALAMPLATGDVVISGFSGARLALPSIPTGVDPIDETIIDPNGGALRFIDLSTLGGPTVAQAVDPPTVLSVPAAEIGQVFSLVFDDGGSTGVPNLYAAATSAYGLQIVGTAAGTDGAPVRLKQGAPGAVFMAGQFGSLPGAGPGTIYRIDGTTGAVTVFADTGFSGILNTGAGIGGLAFDPQSGAIYASDLDTGLIHRFNVSAPGGADLGQFDHGVAGLQAQGLPPVPDDGAFANIVDPSFHPDDPSTWGMTPPARRVGALAVHDGRLFYSVADGPSVWSVGISSYGSFGTDPRIELRVSDGVTGPITGIAFDAQGDMILAQRGDQQGPFDYSRFTASGAPVLRYAPAADTTNGLWSTTPDEYPVGLPDGSRMGSGGVALANGYNPDGTLGAACGATLLTTGDDLRDNPALAAQLPAGPVNLAGIQLNDAALFGAQNTPPAQSAFVAFDPAQADPSASGHVGSVAAVPCGVTPQPPADNQGVAPANEGGQNGGGGAPAAPNAPALGDNGGNSLPGGGNARNPAPANDAAPQPLTVTKVATVDSCEQEGAGCSFAVTVHNPNRTTVPGPVKIQDVFTAGGAPLTQSRLTSGPQAPWTCVTAGGSTMACSNPNDVPPGDTTLNLTFSPGQIGQATDVMNCTQLLDTDTPLVQLTPLPPMAQPAPAPTSSSANGITVVAIGGDDCSLATDDGCSFTIFVDQVSVEPNKLVDIKQTFTLGADPTPIPVTIVEQSGLPDGINCLQSADQLQFDCDGMTNQGQRAFQANIKVKPKLPPGSPASALVDNVQMTSGSAAGSASDSVKLKDAPAPATTDADVQKQFQPQQCAVIPVNKSPTGIPGLDKPAPIVDGLKLVKTADPSTPDCAPGKPCTFDITITNTAATPHTGPITFHDVLASSAGANSADIVSAATMKIDSPWTCEPFEAGQTTCTGDVTIPAGQSVVAKASVTLDSDFTGTAMLNCAGLGPVFGMSCAQIPFDQPTPSAVNGVTISKKVTDGHTSCKIDDSTRACSFDITVTNTTDNAIAGPINLRDQMTGEAGKPSGYPGDFDKPAEGDVSCGPKGTPDMTCKIGGGLKAGESKTFTIVFTPHGTDSSFVKNCATLDGGDAPACATENIDPASKPATNTPAPQVSRLIIDESTQNDSAASVHQHAGDTGSCTLAGACNFGIAITNTGTTTFTGPLSFSSGTSPGSHSASLVPIIQSVTSSSDDPNWSCTSTTNPGSTQLQCDYRGQITLAPGQGTLVRVAVIPGSGWVKSNTVSSCANTQADPNSGHVGNNWCATRILDPFNVKIQKTGDQSCPAGADCHFQLTLFNPGPIDHNAPVTISDKLNVGTAPIVSINPPLPCAVQPTQVPFTCTSPGPISLPLGGAPQIFDVVIRLPAGERGYTNCATVGPDANAAANTADSTTSCVTTVVTPATAPVNSNTGGTNGTVPQTAPDTAPKGFTYKPIDLSFKKTGPAQCTIGDVCTFTFLFTSGYGFFGSIKLTDSMDIGPAPIVSITPPMPCATQPTQLPMTCDFSSITHVQAGQLLFYRVAVRIPARIRASSLTNCVVWDAQSSKDFNGNAYIDDAKSCATVVLTPPRSPLLPPPPDGSTGGYNKVYPQGDAVLTLRKTGDEQCAIDGLCNFNLTISSDRDFSGPIILSDSLDIGPASIVSIQPPLACGTAPTQLPLACDTAGQPVVNVPVGMPLTYRMTIRVPNTTASQMTNCATVYAHTPLDNLGLYNSADGQAPSCVTVTLTPPNSNPAPQCFSNMMPDGKGGCGCPPEQTWDGQQCSSNTGGTNGTMPGTLQCPAGTVGIYPACRAQAPAKVQPKVTPACPAGTTGTYPNCKAAVPKAPKKLKCAPGTHPSTNGRACIPDLKPKPKPKPKAPPQQPTRNAPSFQNGPGFNIGGFNGMPDINIGGFQMGNGGGFGGGFGGGGRRQHPSNDDNQTPKGGGGGVNAPPANDAPPKGGGGTVGKPPVCPPGETFQNGRCDILVK